MFANATGVQYSRGQGRERFWLKVADSAEDQVVGGEVDVERISLDIRRSDFEWLLSYAEYRNAIAAAQGRKLKVRWSRKSMTESLLAEKCNELRARLTKMTEALGPLPTIDTTSPATKKLGRKAMQKYAERVAAWDKKHADKK